MEETRIESGVLQYSKLWNIGSLFWNYGFWDLNEEVLPIFQNKKTAWNIEQKRIKSGLFT